jgi:hypothetical protein
MGDYPQAGISELADLTRGTPRVVPNAALSPILMPNPALSLYMIQG